METVSLHPLAQGILGDGIVVLPYEGKLVSPFSGEIVSILPNQHVITLRSDEGIELLIHIGINSKKASSELFRVKKASGDRINPGDSLIEFDLPQLKEAGIDSRSMVVLLENEAAFNWKDELNYLEPFVEIEGK
ncbi:PTS sugar transporter subunit IIA [Candidatus Enterococcus ferrettii]|uniref:PTS EIIA type-1 domain-containing protein n=1 Tax=Candidatus Enterococcus ferrettii TaxID=2815324 RepID=A0ABV0ET20_9ENTE|nr:PTS glucose transporter subunit IIA [Enterococcus sp. 665A]MBO1342623.1 PTS glucose transporter subunit IIA [Enterococcus sp. 665A]